MTRAELIELTKAVSSSNVADSIFEEHRPSWAQLQGKVIRLIEAEVDEDLDELDKRRFPSQG